MCTPYDALEWGACWVPRPNADIIGMAHKAESGWVWAKCSKGKAREDMAVQALWSSFPRLHTQLWKKFYELWHYYVELDATRKMSGAAIYYYKVLSRGSPTMGNYRFTMTHYTTMDFVKCYELLWTNSGFADGPMILRCVVLMGTLLCQAKGYILGKSESWIYSKCTFFFHSWLHRS